MSPHPPLRRTPSFLRETTGDAVHASRAAPASSRLSTVAVSLVAAVFLALSGAFDTGGAPFLLRLGFWVLAMGVGSALGSALTQALARRGWLEGGPVKVILMVSVAATAPLVAVVWLLAGVILQGRLDPARLPWLTVPVFAVTLLVTAVNVLLGLRAPAQTHARPASPGETPAPPRFLERIPVKLRAGELLAVQAEDHYLRVHTTAGSDLILLRLSDALAELDGVEGAQTHRGWWVARESVAHVDRGDGRAVLTLKNGAQAPVSRTYAKALRDAGWF